MQKLISKGTGEGTRLLAILDGLMPRRRPRSASVPIAKSVQPPPAPQPAPVAIRKSDGARRQEQRAEGLFGAMFAETREKTANLRRAAGITAPNPNGVTQQAPSYTQALADAEARAGRPLMQHERQMVESAAAQAAVLQQIKAMHSGDSTGPQSLA
jgi:hypothetical protein